MLTEQRKFTKKAPLFCKRCFYEASECSEIFLVLLLDEIHLLVGEANAFIKAVNGGEPAAYKAGAYHYPVGEPCAFCEAVEMSRYLIGEGGDELVVGV